MTTYYKVAVHIGVKAGKDKGVYNLSNQLSNFFKNWVMQQSKTAFCEFHKLNVPYFCSVHLKIAIIPTIFTEKYVKFLEISLEMMIWIN